MYFNACSQPIIVMNALASAADLLVDRRSANYSDCPNNIATLEVLTVALYLPFIYDNTMYVLPLVIEEMRVSVASFT